MQCWCSSSCERALIPLSPPFASLNSPPSASSPLFLSQNAKKREALDAAQAKKKNANFSVVVPDRDWTEEEKQVRVRRIRYSDCTTPTVTLFPLHSTHT